jgi:hypothetical protein
VPFLVHGVSRGLPDAATEGADVPAFRSVAAGDLVGLASETEDTEALPTRANLLHHTQVLEHVGAHVTVLPMRFGVVVPDLDALVTDFLEPEGERLLATLERIEGHVELRLRGRYEEAHVIREVLDSDPRAAQLRGRRSTEAKMELGERIVEGIARQREHDTARVTAALGSHVAALTTAPAAEPLDAFSLSCLVAEQQRADFEAAVDEIGTSLAPLVRLELVGPIPPFSFTDLAEEAWA